MKLEDIPNYGLMSNGSESLPWPDDVAKFVKGLALYIKQQDERIEYLERRLGINPPTHEPN